MKIAFVSGGYENIGLEYISAVLKKSGHQVRLFVEPQLFNDESFTFPRLNKFFSQAESVVRRLTDFSPDIAGFSVFSDFYPWACDLAAMIKRRNPTLPIIFGGIHPTSVPEYVIQNDFVDMVCIGEGEYPMLELVESLKRGGPDYHIKNIWFKKNGSVIKNPLRPLVADLDTLPLADKELFYEAAPYFKIDYFIASSRGCPYTCSYCYNSFLKQLYHDQGAYLRKRSVLNVLSELEFFAKKYKYRYIRFFDDVFTFDKNWLKEFSQQYPQRIGKPFLCYVRADDLDEEMVVLLKNAGCIEVEFGVQTWDENTRKRILNRFISNKQIIEAVRLLKKHRILITTDNILGIPSQTAGELEELAGFYNDNRVSRMHLLWLRYYPKTLVVETAQNLGVLKQEDVERINRGLINSPYTQGGSTYSKTLAQFQTLFVLLPLVPPRIIRLFLKKKWYGYLAAFPPFILRIFTNLFESNSRFDRIMRKRDFLRYVSSGVSWLKMRIGY